MSRNKFNFQILILLTLVGFILSGCSDTANEDAPLAIESYIKALSDKDSNQVSNLSCADWEQNALVELDSLTAVGSSVEELACQESGSEAENVFISCTGSIVLDYDGEIQKIDLSTRTYIATQEGGEWRMCGYR